MCNCKNKCDVCTCQKIQNVWIVFSGTEDDKELDIIKTKLSKFIESNKEMPYKYKCLFLPRKVVEQKGFKTDLVDILNNCGANIEFILDKYNSFEECMDNINKERIELSKESDKILSIIPTENISNMYKELSLFVERKIIFI